MTAGGYSSTYLFLAPGLAVTIIAVSLYASLRLGATDGDVVFQMLRQESDWGYGATNGPQTWGVAYPACKGSVQSPVNIIDRDVEGFVVEKGRRATCTDNSRNPPIVRTISDDATAFKSCSDPTGPKCRAGETCTSGVEAITLTPNAQSEPARRFAVRWPNTAGLYTQYSSQLSTIQARRLLLSRPRTSAHLRPTSCDPRAGGNRRV